MNGSHDQDDHAGEHTEEEGLVDGRSGRDRRSTVVAVTRLTPSLIRVTLDGDTEDVIDNGGDQHITVNFVEDDAIVPFPLTHATALQLSRFVNVQMRRYTVRQFHGSPPRMDVDAVVHPDGGPGCRWAERVSVGDQVWWWGPTSGWHPRSTTTTLLAVGDETALPAIEALIREAPATMRVIAVVEVGDPGDERYLDEVAGRARVTWVRRTGALGAGSPELLSAIEAVTGDLGLQPGATEGLQVWGAAEYTTVQGFRRHFHGRLGLCRADAFLVTYWTRGQPQDLRSERRQAVEIRRNRLAHPEEARLFLRRS